MRALSYTPWHSLTEYRPLGRINRLRRAVYDASADHTDSQMLRFWNWPLIEGTSWYLFGVADGFPDI